MQKQLLLNAFGVAALSLFCACGPCATEEKKDEAQQEQPMEHHEAEEAVNQTEALAEVQESVTQLAVADVAQAPEAEQKA